METSGKQVYSNDIEGILNAFGAELMQTKNDLRETQLKNQEFDDRITFMERINKELENRLTQSELKNQKLELKLKNDYLAMDSKFKQLSDILIFTEAELIQTKEKLDATNVDLLNTKTKLKSTVNRMSFIDQKLQLTNTELKKTRYQLGTAVMNIRPYTAMSDKAVSEFRQLISNSTKETHIAGREWHFDTDERGNKKLRNMKGEIICK